MSLQSTLFPVYEPVNIVNWRAGSAIKDLEDGEISEKKKAYLEGCKKVQEAFERKLNDYNRAIESLKPLVENAQSSLPEDQLKKILSISVFALAIIGTIGVFVAAAMTGMLPLLFAAAPLFCLLIVSGYFSIKYINRVWQAEHYIERFNGIQKPEKGSNPIYHPINDLDYRSSRLSVIQLMQHDSISRLARSDFKRLVDYRLLENSSADTDTVGRFYGKVDDLIIQYKSLKKPKPHHHPERLEAYNQAVATLDSYLFKFKQELNR